MKVLEGLKKYILWLMLFSGIISYFSLQIANYIRYAIDGILFHNHNQIPNYLNILLEMGTIKGLMIISMGIMIINLIIVIAKYIRDRITTVFTLKISSNLRKILYAHVLKLEYQSYQSYSKVEMLQRVNEDAVEYANFYKVQFNLILDIVSLSFFIVSQSIFLSVSITIYLVITIAIMLIFAFWYYRKMTRILDKVITKRKKMLGATIREYQSI